MINEKGYWETDSSFGHVYDNRLAMAIGEFLKKQNVKNLVDFGCGMGDYVKLWKPKHGDAHKRIGKGFRFF